MRFLEVPWLEFSIATTLIGALWVSQIREPYRAARMGLVFTGIAFVFAFLAWLDYYVGIDTDSISRASLEPYIFGREVFVDELAAKLARLPFVAVVGRSGSGKSSLVRAALLPRLHEESAWRILVMRPGAPYGA